MTALFLVAFALAAAGASWLAVAAYRIWSGR